MRWDESKEKELKKLISEGKPYKEISEIMETTIRSITNKVLGLVLNVLKKNLMKLLVATIVVKISNLIKEIKENSVITVVVLSLITQVGSYPKKQKTKSLLVLKTTTKKMLLKNQNRFSLS